MTAGRPVQDRTKAWMARPSTERPSRTCRVVIICPDARCCLAVNAVDIIVGEARPCHVYGTHTAPAYPSPALRLEGEGRGTPCRGSPRLPGGGRYNPQSKLRADFKSAARDGRLPRRAAWLIGRPLPEGGSPDRRAVKSGGRIAGRFAHLAESPAGPRRGPRRSSRDCGCVPAACEEGR